MENNQFRTLIFDWGNTIMIDDGLYPGKMVDWPKVTEVQNAYQTLKLLSENYQLVLATNAEDSSALEVSNALERVHLNSFFDHIFTYHELKTRKPDVLFFRKIIEKLNIPSHQAVIIGDDYQKDISAAKKTGLSTIWFNPMRLRADANLPLQDAEVKSFMEIPDILQQPFLPDIQTCLSWYIESGATHTLLSHVFNVAAIAYQISYWMKERGENVNPLLSHRGGLTHDLAKLHNQEKKNHGILAAEFLESQSQFELAEIARRHLIGDLISEETRPKTWEQKIVNYADKLSEGHNLVSLDHRLNALQLRYPEFSEKIKKNTPFVKALENEIVSVLNLTPDELLSNMKQALFNKNSY